MASVSDDCIFCKEPVRERQQGVQCDGCSKWNHRTCNTGISQEAYRTAVREGADITWCCASCLGDPVAESTMNGETSADILVSEEFNPPLDSSADLFEQSMEVAESVTSEQEQSMDTSYAAVFDQSMEVAEAVTSEQEQSMDTSIPASQNDEPASFPGSMVYGSMVLCLPAPNSWKSCAVPRAGTSMEHSNSVVSPLTSCLR
ncbi:uncharacterized protein LOC144647949 [Oculina patagonica]